MPHDIICADCGATRQRAQYKNTLYCHACRLLRDLVFAGAEQRSCSTCPRQYVPVSRRDKHCGHCDFGSIYTGDCALCQRSNADIYRPGVAVCLLCLRDPAQRRTLLAGLKNGHRARRLEHAHA